MANFGERADFIRRIDVKSVGGWAAPVREDKLAMAAMITWLVFLILSAGTLLWFQKKLPAEVPLFYSRPWGENMLAQRQMLWLPIAGTLLLGLGDFGFGISLYNSNKFLSRVLFGIGALVSVLSALAVVNIIFLIK